MAKNITVIGAGASGLTAAISAAGKGAQVTILEAQERPGRKLLVTGNGRCNLTNTSAHLPEEYHGSGADLARRLTGRFGAKETLEFFSQLGLLTQEKNGCVYPCTMQSDSVLDVLLAELRIRRVNFKFSQKILRITDNGWSEDDALRYAIETPSWVYRADAVILACGSMAAPSTGASEAGYLLAQTLGHRVIAPRPALVPLASDFSYLNRFAGVRCRAKLTLLQGGEKIAEETGELQWTKYGISGIVAFQLSRYVSTGGKGYSLQIDLLPDHTAGELEALLSVRAAQLNQESTTVLLRGILNEKMIKVILECASAPAAAAGEKLTQKSCADLKESDIRSICRAVKCFSVPVTGTRSFDQAQVCAGGVDCTEVTDHLESVLHRDLYFAGELLDVDGPCGGYNLQWAFTSGYLAGQYAAADSSDFGKE